MWLLDANMDVHLAAVLAEFGIRCDTAGNRGWKALTSWPQFAIVIVDLPQQRWQQYRERFIAAWADSPIQPVPGGVIHWPHRRQGQQTFRVDEA